MSKRKTGHPETRQTARAQRGLQGAARVLIRWGSSHFAGYPWRGEGNPFHALVAEILLQRTRAEQVIAPFRAFKKAFPNPAALADADTDQVSKVIGSLGLRWRARFLTKLGKQLAERKRFPDELDSLLALPGVGPYAANAFLSFHRGKRGVLLDSNIVRFYGRYVGLRTGPESRRTQLFRQIADSVTPKRASRVYNYAVLDFTRSICRPTPLCMDCPLRHHCAYRRSASAALVTAAAYRLKRVRSRP